MNIIHQSRDLKYKNPYGAVPSDKKVNFAIYIQESENVIDCYLNYSYGLQCFYNGRSRMIASSQNDMKDYFECSIKAPDEACLWFYWFEIVTDKETSFYCCNYDSKDGYGIVSSVKPVVFPSTSNEPRPFQITVYEKSFITPDWFKGCVIYQIFPDRFNRGKNFSYEKMINARNMPERIYHENWNEDVDFKGTKEFGYLACDFYGGSLNGINEKLDYLEELGIDAIYLNPVFESRSNHRYDTGNYENVDPILGVNDDFVKLTDNASNKSMKVILDGVYSHTGADSIYFNKLGRYNSPGAYQDAQGKDSSPYISWYNFYMQHGVISYDSWWGFTDLPCVNENDLKFKEYILGENGVMNNWMIKGASGWRLDVSDELPDNFLRELRTSVKRKDSNAIIMGEVWEDASNKISYGSYRDFLIGNTHDCVMGYPFRNAVIGWLSGKISLSDMNNSLETIRENYPIQAFYCNMNLIGSHDIPRPITDLSGDSGVQTREEQSAKFLSIEQREFGLKLMKLAMLIQFTYPGSPSIYYGDEIAMEGYKDPFNRRTFNWDIISDNRCEIYLWIKALIHFRKKYQLFKTGLYETISVKDDIYIFRRFFADNIDAFGTCQNNEGEIFILINRNPYDVKIFVPNFSGELSSCSGVIIYNGVRVFETSF